MDTDGPSQADALPPIAPLAPQPVHSNCPDAAASLVYLITQSGTLLSFDPSTFAFSTIGPIGCGGGTPNSMAVDHTGIAYVGFSDGRLFRVSTKTGSCLATPFVPGGFSVKFGMGFVSDSSMGGETLYIAGFGGSARGSSVLASIDTTTFAVRVVGPFTPTISDPELTGTGGGDLFAFTELSAGGSAIDQIDKATARVVAQAGLPGVVQGGGWAFAFWGGDFYTFTSPQSSGSVVTRFRPTDGSVVSVAKYPEIIVGAGVSTCAPQQ